MNESKPWYLSKSIMVNLLMGLAMMVAVFQPQGAEFIKSYFAEAGTGWAIVNIVLRLITKKEIS